jgi:hypothetical protein
MLAISALMMISMMMRKWASRRFAALAVAIAGIRSAAAAEETDLGTYVLGVEPKTASVLIHPGKIKEGAFLSKLRIRMLYDTNPYQVAPNGYVIAQADADTTYAIVAVNFGGKTYEVCGGAAGLTFTLPKGEAVYLGTIFFETEKDGLRFQIAGNVNLAKLQLSFTQPDLADRLKPAALVKLPVGNKCTNYFPTTIPIYIY